MSVARCVQRPANGSPTSSAQNLDFVAAGYHPDSPTGPQVPAPTGGDSGANPTPAAVSAGNSSDEATGGLEVPTSLEQVGDPKSQAPLKLSWASVIPWRV